MRFVWVIWLGTSQRTEPVKGRVGGRKAWPAAYWQGQASGQRTEREAVTTGVKDALAYTANVGRSRGGGLGELKEKPSSAARPVFAEVDGVGNGRTVQIMFRTV
jgi:hypothetical protein